MGTASEVVQNALPCKPNISTAGRLRRIRFGNQWLVADNTIEGAAFAAPIGPFWKTVMPPKTPQNPNPPDPNPATLPGPYIDAYSCLQINNVVPRIFIREPVVSQLPASQG